ncbi:hypothetical protein FNV43_RR02455 [Rhamnella rubrinervis]|uniref:Uncharacterized protein n=1 Tax=Rhamnella rubrinervis TaxID=2594499 RepID=A0A8K0HS98_9ROSA|nr:hypothetical protein FNV43_RR02455 [Rhamnella rubrinervis]
MNCCTSLWNDLMLRDGKRLNQSRAGPFRLEWNTLHITASLSDWGMQVGIMACLKEWPLFSPRLHLFDRLLQSAFASFSSVGTLLSLVPSIPLVLYGWSVLASAVGVRTALNASSSCLLIYLDSNDHVQVDYGVYRDENFMKIEQHKRDSGDDKYININAPIKHLWEKRSAL